MHQFCLPSVLLCADAHKFASSQSIEFIGLGFEARIVVVNEQKLDPGFLGKTIQARTLTEMEAAGIDPSGELGEYHTVVTDGPLFSSKVEIRTVGRERNEGYGFFKVDL